MVGIDLKALRVAWTIFLFLLLMAVVWYIRSTLVLFAAAIFFAYMLSPIVGLVEHFIKKRRGLALTIVYCFLIGLLVLIGFELVPILAGQAISLATKLPTLISGGTLSKLPLPKVLEPAREQLIPILQRSATDLQSRVVPFLQEAGARILSGLSAILPVILVPILALFFLKDARTIRTALLASFPRRHRPTMEKILTDVHLVLRNYIRALVLLALSSFCAWSLFLSILRYPYELLLGGMCAVLEFIPVVGPAAALAVLLIVLLVTGSGGLLWIILFWAAFRVFQDYVLSPYLMSSGIELHPLLVLFGVLAGDALAGVPGMFFSVPMLAILRVVFNRMQERSSREQIEDRVYQAV